MTIQIARKALSRVMKHGLNVYPLEAYGFLIGESNLIHAALPVAHTTEWYEPASRFKQLDAALANATETAKLHGSAMVGTYHSDSGGHPDWPESEVRAIEYVPPQWRDKLLLINLTDGGESIWGHRLYQFESGKWVELPYKSIGLWVEQPRLNPRRILHDWSGRWSYVPVLSEAQMTGPQFC